MRTARTVIVAACLLAIAACAEEASAPTEEQDSATPTPTRVRTATPSPSPTPFAIRPLAIGDVFAPRDLTQYNLDPARLRTVIATGDVIPARYTDFTIRNLGDDFLYPVRATSDITAAADITVINLEAPLVEHCPVHVDGFTFCGRPGFVAALQEAGVDVATLENNHIGNYGKPGIDETVRHLEAGAIKWADRDTAAIVDVRGLKFGFLGVGAVGEVVDRDGMAAQIKALRPQVDVLAVGVHWGAEYVSLPQSAGGVALDNPVELAHLMVDSGADLVIGNHPHWVQAVEVHKDGYIAYAHGNFIFDQMWSYETRVGVIGKYTFYDDVLIGVEYTPTLIENYAQPVPMQGAERQAVLDGMKAASEELAGP